MVALVPGCCSVLRLHENARGGSDRHARRKGLETGGVPSSGDAAGHFVARVGGSEADVPPAGRYIRLVSSR